jgi:predicted acylesterase/phospholipase RssA
MTIKHLVISGGGPIMVQILGAIQHLEQHNFVDMKNIESIYGTSAGAIVGILICLKYDWETINDYIIKRPWQDVFPIKVQYYDGEKNTVLKLDENLKVTSSPSLSADLKTVLGPDCLVV